MFMMSAPNSIRLLQKVQTATGAHPDVYSMGTRGFISEGTVALHALCRTQLQFFFYFDGLLVNIIKINAPKQVR
jgi:hypothetical protein